MNVDITQSESGGVTITPPAKEKITELLSGADQSQSSVRVFVSGGGCGGMNYGMTFAESVEETDRLIQDRLWMLDRNRSGGARLSRRARRSIFRMTALARRSCLITSSRR
jgi:hypothetical protein